MIPPEYVINRLKENQSRLKSLIISKTNIVSIHPFAEKNIKLESGMLFYGKVFSQLQPTPFKIHIVINYGSKTTFLYLSSTIEMLKQNNCDKMLCLKMGKNSISLESKNKASYFKNNQIYFTIEAHKEAELTLECSFGKYAARKKSDDQTLKIERKPMTLSQKDIDEIISKLKEHPEKLEEHNKMVLSIIEKRKKKSFNLSNPIDIIKKNKKLIKGDLIGCLKIGRAHV